MKKLQVRVLVEGYIDESNQAVSVMRPVLKNQGVEGATASDCDKITIEVSDDNESVLAVGEVMMDIHGNAELFLPETFENGNYWVKVAHRNSIAIWTAERVSFEDETTTYDFTTDTSKAFDSNQTLDHLENACMYSGDINQDDTIDGLDHAILESDVNSFATGYLSSDLNGDGAVDTLDLAILYRHLGDEFIGIRPPIRK